MGMFLGKEDAQDFSKRLATWAPASFLSLWKKIEPTARKGLSTLLLRDWLFTGGKPSWDPGAGKQICLLAVPTRFSVHLSLLAQC